MCKCQHWLLLCHFHTVRSCAKRVAMRCHFVYRLCQTNKWTKRSRRCVWFFFCCFLFRSLTFPLERKNNIPIQKATCSFASSPFAHFLCLSLSSLGNFQCLHWSIQLNINGQHPYYIHTNKLRLFDPKCRIANSNNIESNTIMENLFADSIVVEEDFLLLFFCLLFIRIILSTLGEILPFECN